jgi:hypothetical protein
MVDQVLKNATETAWTVYRARNPEIGDSGRSALSAGAPPAQETGRATERHRRARQLRISVPAPSPQRRVLNSMKMLVARVANGSTRPSWTLLAISFLISAVIVIGLRIAFGV